MTCNKTIKDNYKNIGFKDLSFLVLFIASGSLLPILSNYIIKFFTDSLMNLNWIYVICSVFAQSLIWIFSISINSYEQNVRQRSRTKSESQFQVAIRKKLYSMPTHYLSLPENLEIFSKANRKNDLYLVLFRDIASIIIRVPAIIVAIIPLVKSLPISILLLIVLCCTKIIISLKCSELEYLNTVRQLESERKRNYYKGLLINNLTNKEIKSFNASEWLLNKYDNESSKVFEQTSELHKHNTNKQIVSDIIVLLFDVFVRLLIVFQIINSSFPVSDCLLLFGLWETSNSLIEELQFSFVGVRENFRIHSDIKAFFNQTSNEDCNIAVGEVQRIDLNNISFSYPPEFQKKVLDKINLRFKKNNSYLILGENGAGKSTLIKLILNQYKSQNGTILINNEYELSHIKNLKIGYMAQDDPHFSLTLKENIVFGSDFDSKRFDYVIRRSGLESLVESLPEKEDTLLGFSYGEGRELSGGQWQRINFARLLYNQNDIIVLDEPTANLDPVAEKKLFQEINDIFHDKIIIMVSHRLSSINFVDQIIYMENGSVLGVGSHKELWKKCTKYRELFNITEDIKEGNFDEAKL